MRKIREVLRLSFGQGLSIRDVCIACALPRSTVAEYLGRAKKAGITWPLSEDLDDAALEERLFGVPTQENFLRPIPNWSYVHRELRRPHMTLMLLWTEYREAHPDGYGYTQFCEYYRRFSRTLAPTMRQRHVAGDKVFVDFAGDTLGIYGPDGEIATHAQIFVAVLGASNFTYVEALESQNLYHVIGAHVRAFGAFGGVPRAIVCDNMKTAVTKADRYEPTPNATYLEMATHYQMAVLPGRPFHPRDYPELLVIPN
ncbi:MAG: IS21 family transposase [Ferrimicrobium sp.]